MTMGQPRILFLSTRAPYPPTTGHFQRTFNILKELSTFGEIFFFGFYDKGLSQNDVDEVDRELGKICRSIHIEHIPEERNIAGMLWLGFSSLFTTRPLISKKYFRSSMQRSIEELLSRTRIDIVHLDMLPLAEYLPLFPDMPIALTNQNVESLRLARWAATEKNLLKRWFLKLQARRLAVYEAGILKKLKYCIAMSETDKGYLQALNPDCNLIVIPNGTDTSFYSPAAEKEAEQPNILWIGGMRDPYNRQAVLFFLDEVFPRIAERIPNVKWTVVGRDPPDRLVRLGNQHVELPGLVRDVRPYYHRAHVFVVPLLSGSGTKLKVIEGLSMGMPIVTTTVGAEGLAVEHGKDIFINDDAVQFAESVIRLLENPVLRRNVGSSARTLAADRYDWKVIGAMQRHLYEEILGPTQLQNAAPGEL